MSEPIQDLVPPNMSCITFSPSRKYDTIPQDTATTISTNGD
jgi:hypothetical protein